MGGLPSPCPQGMIEVGEAFRVYSGTVRHSLKLLLALLPLLLLAGCSDSEPAEEEERVLTILYWQAPSLPWPYLSGGTKDQDAGAITLEPLARYDPDGRIVPALAADVPTLENGGFARDLMTITWTLRDGLKWSDGSELTAGDVVFTWRYCMDEGTGCTARSAFSGVASVEALDDLTVRIGFVAPTPYPYGAFVGSGTPIISRAQFSGCVGAAAASCTEQNTRAARHRPLPDRRLHGERGGGLRAEPLLPRRGALLRPRGAEGRRGRRLRGQGGAGEGRGGLRLEPPGGA